MRERVASHQDLIKGFTAKIKGLGETLLKVERECYEFKQSSLRNIKNQEKHWLKADFCLHNLKIENQSLKRKLDNYRQKSIDVLPQRAPKCSLITKSSKNKLK